ncbi:hypothetical protein F5888DRAFT_1233915 [Russula emetica]|nr:hypothetical protein F5888DRAFT_1233915 [Russula emetica]
MIQPPRKVRTITRKRYPQKKESSQKRPRPYPATTSKSSNGPCDGPYPEAVAQSTTTVQLLQPEQLRMSHYPQVSMESMRVGINPSSQRHQMDGFAQGQVISPPPSQVEHAYPQAPREALGAGAAGYMVDQSDLYSEAREVSKMYKYLNLDGNGDS